jgi:hypothetical protein
VGWVATSSACYGSTIQTDRGQQCGDLLSSRAARSPRALYMRRSLQLAALVFAAKLGAPRAEDDDKDFGWSVSDPDLTCYIHGDHASVQPIDDGYNVANATFSTEGKMFINLVLEDQEAQFELPGMVLRVSTDYYIPPGSLDDPFANIDELKQGIWSTVGGNLLGMLFCAVSVSLIVYLEQKYQCIGGEKIHELLDQQSKLQGELNNAVEFLKEIEGDPGELMTRSMDANKNGKVDEEDIMMAAGKKVAAKAADGALVSTMGASKAAAVKKGAEKVAETDQFAEAKDKAMDKAGEGERSDTGRKTKKKQSQANRPMAVRNPLHAHIDSDDDEG